MFSDLVFMKKITLLILIIFKSGSFVFSEGFDYTTLNGDLSLTDIPVYYGEERFLERINSRSSEESPLGLVFSGGAARAFAHIGVLKKLESENIYPDFIVANSMGSVVALLYAAGVSPDMIKQLMMDYDTKDLFQIRMPLDGGVLDSGKFMSVLYDILGDLDIRDLGIPVAIISEDLVSRRQVVFMEGDFYKILQGSISMPFSFPPVDYNGMKLIDGGVTNLVPVDGAVKYTDRIIVSTALYDLESSFRSFTSVINRAFDIGKTRKGVYQLKTMKPLLIRCDVENFSFMSFQKMDQISERGYESAEIALDTLSDEDRKNLAENRNMKMIENLTAERKVVEERYSESRKRYARTEIIPRKDPDLSFSTGFKMYSGTADDYYLNNLNYLNLKQKFEYRSVEASVSEYWGGADSGIDNRFNFLFLDFLRLKNRMLFNWNEWEYDYSYYYGRADFSLLASMQTALIPFTSIETELDSSFAIDKSMLRSGLDLRLSGNSYYFSGFWFSEGEGFESDLSSSGMGFRDNLKIMFSDHLGMRQKSVLRMPLDSSDTLELYRNDGLRGSCVDGYFDRIIVTNNNLSFFADSEISLGEILIIKDIEASAFCDYFRREKDGISTGLALDFDVSFIGLTSVVFSAFAGYDWEGENIFGGITVSSDE